MTGNAEMESAMPRKATNIHRCAGSTRSLSGRSDARSAPPIMGKRTPSELASSALLPRFFTSARSTSTPETTRSRTAAICM